MRIDVVANLRKPFQFLLMRPSFLIIGAQKSGTTSLYYYMNRHPKILSGLKKEVHFFDGGLNENIDTFEKGIQWYISHFPLKKSGYITGEASPLYIFNPLAARRIFQYLPDIKIIAVLRNPTERAISHYFHEKRKGREHLPILRAFESEEERLAPTIRNKQFKSPFFKNCSYKMRGLYKEQLERYFKYFPQNNIFICSSEELFNNPEPLMKRIFQFLEIDCNIVIKDKVAKNVGHNKVNVDPAVYRYLDDYFHEHNMELYKMIKQNYNW